jgi:hypothetical protein
MTTQATAVPVLVVGTDVLGMTFNPFNQQCAAFNFSAQSSILNIAPPSGSSNEIPPYDEATEAGGMWTDSGTSQSYYVAAGLKLITSTGGETGTAVVSETITDFMYQLALKGGMSGIVGSCMGAGEVTWSTSQARINENYYAFLDAEIDRYTLAFDPEELNMSGGLTASVDVDFSTAANNLPQSFVSSGPNSNVAVFQKFFSQWGSHIVTGVTIGGRVRFTITINKSYVSSSSELGTYINAEYGGITGDGAASDQSGYQKYQSNRVSNFYAHGGDAGDANSLGGNASDANYKAWASSVPGNEAVVAVVLKGIWEVSALFANNASSQMTALQEAFVYFSLAQAAIPFYSYTTTSDSPLGSGETTDWFYTTLENPESLGAYSFQNIAFYVLPQDPNNSLNLNLAPYNAIRLNRLSASTRDHVYHFYTTDTGKDGYSIEPEYSQVPPAPASGGNLPFANMIPIYRFKRGVIIRGDFAPANILIHFYSPQEGTGSDCEGLAFYAFNQPPGDPFAPQ